MSFVLLGILNAQAAGGGGAAAYDLLETQTLTSTATSFTFTGLGSYTDYKHLQIRAVVQTTDTNNFIRDFIVRLNGDTGTNYAWHFLQGRNGLVTSTGSATNDRINLGDMSVSSGTSGNFGAVVIDLLDFSNTSKNTTIRGLGGGYDDNENAIQLSSGLWNNTSAVTSILLQPNATWNVGSRFSLFGIKG